MVVYVDQSGRIEYTATDTVVAFSNGKQKSVKIRAGEKRKLQKIFREAGKTDIFAYKSFAILVFLVIKEDLNKITKVVIDKEFVGKEDLIKNFIVQLVKNDGYQKIPEIHFALVGKSCEAHKRAIAVFRKNYKEDKLLKIGDLLKYIL